MTTFDELFADTTRSAVHLEMRDSYMQTPGFTAWQEGHRHDPNDRASWWRPWLDLMKTSVERGVSVRRARIISEPISDYVRYEYDISFTNIAAGEQIRWLPRRQASTLALPGNDFWVFDDELVLFNHFDGNGEMAPIDSEITKEPAAVKLCVDAFEQVWERAIPHENYQP